MPTHFSSDWSRKLGSTCVWLGTLGRTLLARICTPRQSLAWLETQQKESNEWQNAKVKFAGLQSRTLRRWRRRGNERALSYYFINVMILRLLRGCFSLIRQTPKALKAFELSLWKLAWNWNSVVFQLCNLSTFRNFLQSILVYLSRAFLCTVVPATRSAIQCPQR